MAMRTDQDRMQFRDLRSRFNARRRVLGWVFVGCLCLVCLATPFRPERIGDRLQVLLPVTGLACAALDGRAIWFLGRYFILESGSKIPKAVLGDLPINRRPNGGNRGFPSGHTAAASFGAASLVHQCFRRSHLFQLAAILGAGFTGASRVEADKHNVWQITAGAVLGWIVPVAPLRAYDRLVSCIFARLRCFVVSKRKGPSR